MMLTVSLLQEHCVHHATKRQILCMLKNALLRVDFLAEEVNKSLC